MGHAESMVSRSPSQSSMHRLGGFGLALTAGFVVLVLWVMTTPGQAQPAVPFFETPIPAAGVDGPVWVTELAGNQLWVGGKFNTARDAAPGSPDIATRGLAVMDINTGELLPQTFDIPGEVLGIDFHGDTVWIVGEFSSFNGSPVQNIVALNAVTGARLTNFTASANLQLRDVIYHDGWLYLGGNPSVYNGTSVAKVLRVNPTTGALDTSWTPQVSRFVEALDAHGDLIAVAERAVDLRSETKLISTVTGLKVDGLDAASKPTSGMWDAEFSSDGTSVYLAETGNSIVKYTTTDQLLWVSDEAEGDMQAVATTDDFVFGGTHEGWNGNEERHLLAFDAATGQLQPWNVQTNSYWGVRDIAIFDQGLVASGEFTYANGINTRRLAIFRPTGAWIAAEPLDLSVPGDVNCDDVMDIVDALYLVQYSVNNRTDVINCDSFDADVNIHAASGDVNDDGTAGLIDALLIAQCSVGNQNVFCP